MSISTIVRREEATAKAVAIIERTFTIRGGKTKQ